MAEAEQSADDTVTVWQPQSGPQTALISCPVYEVFFGGARGGGKTDGVLGDFIEHADTYGEHAIGLMIRRTLTELGETIERSRTLYTPLGWTYSEQAKMWRAPNGARLRFAYLERDADAEGYQGHSYTRLYIEEIGNFPSSKPILKLMATLRSGAGVPVGIRATGNPGGPGHHWVRARYIDPAPMGWRVITDSLTGLERVFIPSKVQDNKYLGQDYVQRLKASGSAELVRAWLEGDWSVIDGAFFDCWSNAKHVVRPFAIPKHWLRFRAGDWGSAKPFAFGWFAVVSDDFLTPDGKLLPRGCLVMYREWYGIAKDESGNYKADVGLKLDATVVGKGVRVRDYAEVMGYGVLDPAAFATNGGPSIAEMMQAGGQGSTFRPADNARVTQRGAMGGWDQMRGRLVGDEDGNAMLVFFDTCIHAIRTIPALQHDEAKPEDLNTSAEDHAADMTRYGCMSRPWVRKAPEAEKPKIKPGQVPLPAMPDEPTGTRIRI